MAGEIKCEDCGGARWATRKNTKYCHVCRLLRDTKFVGSKTSDCFICDKTFAPLNRNDDMCAECDDLRRSYNVDGTCALCERPGLLWRKEIAVCRSCVRNPQHRATLIKSLQVKQKNTRRAQEAA